MGELEKEIGEGVKEALKKGLLEIIGHNENGEPLYRLTGKGEKYVENMPYWNTNKET